MGAAAETAASMLLAAVPQASTTLVQRRAVQEARRLGTLRAFADAVAQAPMETPAPKGVACVPSLARAVQEADHGTRIEFESPRGPLRGNSASPLHRVSPSSVG